MGLELRRYFLVGRKAFMSRIGINAVETLRGRAVVVLVAGDHVPERGDGEEANKDDYGIVHALLADGDRSRHAEQWDGEKTPGYRRSAH